MKLRKGNVFTPVCQSFCSQGRGCLPQRMLAYSPPGRHPPFRPPGQTPPPADGYCCGRYASYWNAFMFYKSRYLLPHTLLLSLLSKHNHSFIVFLGTILLFVVTQPLIQVEGPLVNPIEYEFPMPATPPTGSMRLKNSPLNQIQTSQKFIHLILLSSE